MKEIKTIGHTLNRDTYVVELGSKDDTHFSGVVLNQMGMLYGIVEQDRKFLFSDFTWEDELLWFYTWEDLANSFRDLQGVAL
jgi:hypothetical protein